MCLSSRSWSCSLHDGGGDGDILLQSGVLCDVDMYGDGYALLVLVFSLIDACGRLHGHGHAQ